MPLILEIQMIAIIVAVSCAVPGVFLVLRKMAMISDAITHTILLGIVIAYFIIKDLQSPFLMVGATVMGIVTVGLIEMVMRVKLVKEDAAIGLVFPFLFSIGIIFISKYAQDVHLDTDSVLLGELAFAPFNRMVVYGVDIGPSLMYSCAGVLLLNVVLVYCFYPQLKVVTFDAILATTMGIAPIFIHYLLMAMVSLTAVSAFDAVGSVLVISFMIGPANTAYLIAKEVNGMLILSVIFAIASAVIGFQVAYFWDVSIAGSMAVVVGVLFTVVFFFSKKVRVIRRIFRKKTHI